MATTLSALPLTCGNVARYARDLGRQQYSPSCVTWVTFLRALAGTSPITRASGKKKTVMARHVHNDRLIDALISQAFTALRTSPGARAFCPVRNPAAPACQPFPADPRNEVTEHVARALDRA